MGKRILDAEDAESWRNTTEMNCRINIPSLVTRLFEITIFNSRFNARHFCLRDAERFETLAKAIRRELEEMEE